MKTSVLGNKSIGGGESCCKKKLPESKTPEVS
jgi:hypothetical protein